ncbi:DUF4345 family protein [Sulfitobacter sabulilitoris]|uniref:DUF4345 family protein n=1 Tax=Sulfitobacter sabulilitoris TaxID=2562655 RepID=UPI001FE27A81|nr:DUF4345 family protein [Sulfitobacter sabulilitoris]
MDSIFFINIALAIVSIVFGAMGWLAPRATMDTLDMQDGATTMARSEVRAASGALFVMAGVGALWLSSPDVFAMIGFIWAGGALGRATSLLLDGTLRKKWVFFAVELGVAALALTINL